MGTVIVVAIAAVIVVIALVTALILHRHRVRTAPGRAGDADTEPPMTDLERALTQVTDRHGRPIGEAIDAEADHVAELRLPDDTGPVLQRALDEVAPPPAARPPAAPAPAPPPAGDDEPTDDPPAP